jgi:hypothetical protein
MAFELKTAAGKLIEQTQQGVEEWVHGVLGGDVPISLGVPGQAANKVKPAGVGLYLFDVARPAPSHGNGRPPIQLSLQYLVTVFKQDIREANRDLLLLLMAAMDQTEYGLGDRSVSMELWEALKVAPRPAFTLVVPMMLERPERLAPRVVTPMVHAFTLGRLDGEVLGPQDRPLADAEVVIRSLNRSTRTDRHGRFSFEAVPGDRAMKLFVRFKGRSSPVFDARQDDGRKPLVLRFNPIEE